MTKQLTYFNLLFAISYLIILIKFPGHNNIQLEVTGHLLIIWYNWDILKRLKGQKTKLQQVKFIVGLLIIPFAGLIIVSSLYRVFLVIELDKMISAAIFLSLVEATFGTTLIIQLSKTLKYYKT
jgi:hypothetical protein